MNEIIPQVPKTTELTSEKKKIGFYQNQTISIHIILFLFIGIVMLWVEVELHFHLILLEGIIMTKRYKNIKVSGRSIKAPVDCYSRIKENARKQNLSMVAYLERLVLEDEVNLVQKAITRHFGNINHLLTQYVDPSFSDIISLLKVIFLRSIQLDTEERRSFLNEFGNILEKQVKSMQVTQEKKGDDENEGNQQSAEQC